MYGKVMSIPDTLMPQWFHLATELSTDEVERVITGLAGGEIHPRDAKRLLARSIVELFSGEDAAKEAEAAFDRVFRDHVAPEQVEEAALPTGERINLPLLLRDLGLVASSSEGRRLISQGAVKINGAKIHSEELARNDLADAVVQVGKRRFVRLVERS
jgi:tyrosyl-tRNA synthetase